MKTVSEVSRLTGISVRTLHHYDAIGLLHPTAVTKAGYRMYDDAALCRLQSILLFRELEFPLKEIKTMLDSPSFDPSEALAQQIHLLELQRRHIDELISFAREIQEKGVKPMAFHAFDNKDLEQYKAEVKERWGETRAYQEYEQKQRDGQDFAAGTAQLMGAFAKLGSMKELTPDNPQVQEQVGVLQRVITENFYTCTPEILSGLGEMYTADERFRENIDRAGGEGTAEFARQAIAAYCKK